MSDYAKDFKSHQFQLFGKNVMGRATFTPPTKISSSNHDQVNFVYVAQGQSRLYAPQHQYQLQTGDFVLMKCENFVNQWLPNEDDSPNEVIILHYYPDLLTYIYNEQLPSFFTRKNPPEPNPVEKFHVNDLMRHYIEGLRYYFNHPDLIDDDLLKVKLQELILILSRTDRSGRVEAIFSSLFQSREYKFKEIIHSNLYEDLKLEDLAHFSGMSLSSFKRKFKAVFGTSPTQYIRSKRLEKAERLIKSTEDRISDIAYDCGFNDIGYFSKSFQAVYKYSPTEYRKMHVS